MLHDAMVALFAIAAGFTASGIVANIYRLVASKPQSKSGQAAYVAVMVVAGPTVLVANASKSWRKKDCSQVAFWIAAAISSYWSFALGLMILAVAIKL
ncbi:MAG: hypothetical protein GC166_14275 [Alphaproteobacteria bacterium]|nr:hypothetical protein [Alphaproteobacteria bacterium]